MYIIIQLYCKNENSRQMQQSCFTILSNTEQGTRKHDPMSLTCLLGLLTVTVLSQFAFE